MNQSITNFTLIGGWCKMIELFYNAIIFLDDFTEERFIYDAYFYAEKRVSIWQVKYELEDLIEKEKLSYTVEMYCYAVLSQKAIPLERSIKR